MKKVILLSISILSIIFMSFQLVVYNNTNETLKYKYKIERQYEKIETRIYDEAMFARIELSKTQYKAMSSKGFRVLADYIFGNNDGNTKIAMTSPVVMEMNEKFSMEFMMPTNFDMTNLPLPNNKEIDIYVKPSWRSASITFGGFADDVKIKSKIEELKNELEKNNIKHKDNFKFLGYNPPFQLMGRKNEVIVEIL